ncbi:unnamed protein product [Aspergillus oryzae]|uniref:Unnamed protein product n=2 Tax=Aspergillus oryzae TaxID=5062 RepID=A0AAN4YWZ4_ASPOZ|nr:unnamed protein product [Aspergillus oryzae]GMF87267.1 unnamed protein product [Aspergillus oryzae]GMG03926.1 unnamed protein product [Aspergillus oryzae]GMG36632.1 unnamed protein product [Aspergillus oryzae]GMG46793.1 unnamed protein product [Aspergillus oryzae var. brunneus]
MVIALQMPDNQLSYFRCTPCFITCSVVYPKLALPVQTAVPQNRWQGQMPMATYHVSRTALPKNPDMRFGHNPLPSMTSDQVIVRSLCTTSKQGRGEFIAILISEMMS